MDIMHIIAELKKTEKMNGIGELLKKKKQHKSYLVTPHEAII